MNYLKECADHLKPLNKAISGYNEFWGAHYFDYEPTPFRISSYGGGCYFNEWEMGQDKKQDGYIPFLSINTDELNGYVFIELNNKNAQKLYDEQPHVYQWLEYIMRREDQDGWEGFGLGDDKQHCHGIGAETLTGVYEDKSTGQHGPANILFLCFGTGGGEAYDEQLLKVIRIKELTLLNDNDYASVGDFISEHCSPKIDLWSLSCSLRE